MQQFIISRNTRTTRNLDTGLAWSLKEMLDHLWTYRSRAHAMSFFYNWLETVEDSALVVMMKVARTLKSHMAGILNYISYPNTNASAEGTNGRGRAHGH